MKNWKIKLGAALATVALVAQIPASVSAAANAQSIFVPAYRYPTTWQADPYWDGLINAGTKAPFVVVNPNSGPGTSVSEHYVTAMTRAKNAGITMVGYVKTGYQTKPLEDVFAEIDAYYSMYGEFISGIFFDEITDDPDKICYLANAHNYVKRKYNNGLTVANPGRHISDAIAPYADIFMTMEQESSLYQNNYPEPTSNFERDAANQNRIYHAVYNVSAAEVDNVLNLTRQRNAGYIYITDDGNSTNTENQYDDLPTYFVDLQNKVTTLPATQLPSRGASAVPTTCNDLTANLTQGGAGAGNSGNAGNSSGTANPTANATQASTTNESISSEQLAQAANDGSKSTNLAQTGAPILVALVAGGGLLGAGLYSLRQRKN